MKNFNPDLYVPRVAAIPFEYLYKERGIKYLLLDLDRTILGSYGFDRESIEAIKGAYQSGFIQEFVILTNSGVFGPVVKERRIKAQLNGQFGQPVRLKCLKFKDRKPKLQGFRMGLWELAYKSIDEVALIDDQPLNIPGGNQVTDDSHHKMFRILVDPLGSYNIQTWLSGRALVNEFARMGLIYSNMEEFEMGGA